MPSRLRVAVAQWQPLLGAIEPNLDKLAEAHAKALQEGADLLLTPELGLTGYLLRDLVPEVALARGDRLLDGLAALGEELPVVAGFVERGEDGNCYNAAGCWGAGGLIHVHRKVYLPTYGLFDESRFFAAGRRIETFPTPLGPLAILICEDLWHPSAVMIAAQQGAAGILVPSASPARGISEGRQESASQTNWRRLIQTMSSLNGCWIAWSSRIGFEDGLCFQGGSMVISPSRQDPVVEASMLQEGVWVAELDTEAIARSLSRSGMRREEDPVITHRHLTDLLEGTVPPGRTSDG